MKKYVKGNIYNGFRLTEEEFVTDIKSNVQIFEHEKTYSLSNTPKGSS